MCQKSGVDENGWPSAGAFELHPGSEKRLPDQSLSVYCPEYLIDRCGCLVKVDVIRDFLNGGSVEVFGSTFCERQMRASWRLAVLNVEALEAQAAPFGVRFECHLEPRSDESALFANEGVIYGAKGPIKPEAARIDPHAAILSLPERGPLEFAVRDYIASRAFMVAPALPGTAAVITRTIA